MRSGGGYFPVSRYMRKDFSSSDFGSTHSAIALLIPLIISSWPLYAMANIHVILFQFFVWSIASRRSDLISGGTSQRSQAISSRIEFLMSFSTSFGILSRNSWKIPAISISERSKIFSFESAHILTYSIFASRQSARIFSILSPPLAWPNETTFESFLAHRLFPSMMNPICLSILYTKKYQENININQKSNEKIRDLLF